MLKEIEAKKLTNEEMDLVVGGTLSEVTEIAKLICEKGGKFGKGVATIYNAIVKSGLAGIGGPLNILLREKVSDALNELGIESNMSVGVAGTGLFSKGNKYWMSGRAISHEAVLKIVEAA